MKKKNERELNEEVKISSDEKVQTVVDENGKERIERTTTTTTVKKVETNQETKEAPKKPKIVRKRARTVNGNEVPVLTNDEMAQKFNYKNFSVKKGHGVAIFAIILTVLFLVFFIFRFLGYFYDGSGTSWLDKIYGNSVVQSIINFFNNIDNTLFKNLQSSSSDNPFLNGKPITQAMIVSSILLLVILFIIEFLIVGGVSLLARAHRISKSKDLAKKAQANYLNDVKNNSIKEEYTITDEGEIILILSEDERKEEFDYKHYIKDSSLTTTIITCVLAFFGLVLIVLRLGWLFKSGETGSYEFGNSFYNFCFNNSFMKAWTVPLMEGVDYLSKLIDLMFGENFGSTTIIVDKFMNNLPMTLNSLIQFVFLILLVFNVVIIVFGISYSISLIYRKKVAHKRAQLAEQRYLDAVRATGYDIDNANFTTYETISETTIEYEDVDNEDASQIHTIALIDRSSVPFDSSYDELFNFDYKEEVEETNVNELDGEPIVETEVTYEGQSIERRKAVISDIATNNQPVTYLDRENLVGEIYYDEDGLASVRYYNELVDTAPLTYQEEETSASTDDWNLLEEEPINELVPTELFSSSSDVIYDNDKIYLKLNSLEPFNLTPVENLDLEEEQQVENILVRQKEPVFVQLEEVYPLVDEDETLAEEEINKLYQEEDESLNNLSCQDSEEFIEEQEELLPEQIVEETIEEPIEETEEETCYDKYADDELISNVLLEQTEECAPLEEVTPIIDEEPLNDLSSQSSEAFEEEVEELCDKVEEEVLQEAADTVEDEDQILLDLYANDELIENDLSGQQSDIAPLEVVEKLSEEEVNNLSAQSNENYEETIDQETPVEEEQTNVAEQAQQVEEDELIEDPYKDDELVSNELVEQIEETAPLEVVEKLSEEEVNNLSAQSNENYEETIDQETPVEEEQTNVAEQAQQVEEDELIDDPYKDDELVSNELVEQIEETAPLEEVEQLTEEEPTNDLSCQDNEEFIEEQEELLPEGVVEETIEEPVEETEEELSPDTYADDEVTDNVLYEQTLLPEDVEQKQVTNSNGVKSNIKPISTLGFVPPSNREKRGPINIIKPIKKTEIVPLEEIEPIRQTNITLLHKIDERSKPKNIQPVKLRKVRFDLKKYKVKTYEGDLTPEEAFAMGVTKVNPVVNPTLANQRNVPEWKKKRLEEQNRDSLKKGYISNTKQVSNLSREDSNKSSTTFNKKPSDFRSLSEYNKAKRAFIKANEGKDLNSVKDQMDDSIKQPIKPIQVVKPIDKPSIDKSENKQLNAQKSPSILKPLNVKIPSSKSTNKPNIKPISPIKPVKPIDKK